MAARTQKIRRGNTLGEPLRSKIGSMLTGEIKILLGAVLEKLVIEVHAPETKSAS
jgi:hypothetical protein